MKAKNPDSQKKVLGRLVLVFVTIVPILYKRVGISDEITLVALAAISSLAGVFHLSNAYIAKQIANKK